MMADRTEEISPTEQPMSSEEDIIQLLSDCLQEADYSRQPYIDRAELNNQQHLGDYGETRAGSPFYVKSQHSSFVLNKTMNSDVTHVQAQLEQRPRVKILPREAGHSATMFYMSKTALNTIRGLIQQGHIQDIGSFAGADAAADLDAAAAELMGEEVEPRVEMESDGFDFSTMDNFESDAYPVTESFIKRITPLTAEWESALDGTPQMPVLMPEDIITINDVQVAEVVQNNCRILWEMGDNDEWLTECVYATTIVGWNFSLYEWDVDKGHDILTNLHPKHVWLPPEATSVKRGEYAIVREPMSKRQACIEFSDRPEICKAIKDFATPNRIGSDNLTVRATRGGPYDDSEMKRSFIDVWYFYLRGKDYPMPVNHAIDMERIVEKDRLFYLPNGEGPITPDDKEWPTCPGITVYTIVADKVAETYECPHYDVNLLLNKSLPIPFRWVAQGQPERLEWLTRLIMRTMSTIYDILKYSRSPQELRPSDVHEALQAQGGDVMYSHPNRIMFMDSAVYMRYLPQLSSGRGFLLDPPKLPDDIVDFIRILLQMHDEISGNTGVLQGRSPGAGTSGKALETLQEAARGIMGFEAAQTEAMLKNMTKMRIHAMCRRQWLPLSMWKKWNSKYPKAVLSAIRDAASRIDFNVEIEIASGGGQIRKAEQQQVREDFGMGLIDPQSALEKLEYPNVDEIMQRVAERNALASQNVAA